MQLINSVNLLSHAGKMQLINSVLFGLENFWCSALLLPQVVIKLVNKLCKNYFRGTPTGQRKMTFQSWGSICAPWQKGGFNIKELLSWNKALISKWLWLLTQGRGGIWVAWTMSYVTVDSSIWTVQSKPHFAESWRAILKVRDHLLVIAGNQQGAQAALNSCVLKGEFVVSKAYNLFRKKRIKLGWTKALICLELLPKHKVCVIQATQQVLSTLDKISARGYPMVNWCCLCETTWESHRHLFFRCSYSKNLCRLMMSWLVIPGCRVDFFS
ncbi:uncharacterized protein LOC141618203 [Silene latifolia]|uniref:uncharacterized protein LOC141618203 n=1 Tax=Silene latifolia TaxID=37657 RepID=UPI003D781796